MKAIERFIFDRPFKRQTIISEQFEIVGLIGKGSYGLVYEVKDHKLGDHCVLKQARPSRNRKAKTDPFLFESRFLTQLASFSFFPNIRASFSWEGNEFLAEDYVKGKTFETLVFEEEKRYGVRESFAILADLLQIAAIMHENGIIHRDLRLPNILHTPDGLRVIDFGLARTLAEADEDEKLLEKNTPIEKVYMREVAPKSDLYALGHTTLFLLYSSYEPTVKKERPWEEELNLPDDAVDILQRLLQIKKPYASAAEAKARVEMFLHKHNEG